MEKILPIRSMRGDVLSHAALAVIFMENISRGYVSSVVSVIRPVGIN
jgi:hypothetical protein